MRKLFALIPLLAMTGCIHAQTGSFTQIKLNPPAAGTPGVFDIQDKTTPSIVAAELNGIAGNLNLATGATLSGTTWKATATHAMIMSSFVGSNEIVFYNNTGLTLGGSFSPSPFFAITNFGGTQLTDSASATTLTLAATTILNQPLTITPSGATGRIIINLASGQSADSFDIVDHSGNTLVASGATGGLNLAGSGLTGSINLESNILATNIANHPPPSLNFSGSYWTGSVSGTDFWEIAEVLGTGTNPSTTLAFKHMSGSTGNRTIEFDNSVAIVPTLGDDGVFVINEKAGQSANPFVVADSSGNTLAVIDAAGDINTLNNLFITASSPATNVANFASGSATWTSFVWDGSNTPDIWAITPVIGSGTNPTSTLTFGHASLASGAHKVQIDNLEVTGTCTGCGSSSPGAAPTFTPLFGTVTTTGNTNAGHVVFSVNTAVTVTFPVAATHSWFCLFSDLDNPVNPVITQSNTTLTTTQISMNFTGTGGDDNLYNCQPW